MAGESQMAQGISAAELQAVKLHAAELRAEGAGGTGTKEKEREAADCVSLIESLEGLDRQIAELLHRVVKDEAPHLDPQVRDGVPAYAREGTVIVFFQPASQHDSRYGSIGFNDEAFLDDGDFWATSFAVLSVSDKFEAKLRGRVGKAAG